MSQLNFLCFCAALSFPLGLLAGCSAPPFVYDEARLLSAEQERYLQRYHELLLRDQDVDYRVQTLRGAPDLSDYAVRRYADLQVGSRSRNKRGLLLVIDADADQARLEVGYALEGVFPDAFAYHIEQRQMVPFFEQGRVGEGIVAATELLVSRIQEPRSRSDLELAVPIEGSGGGGASAAARLGAGAGTTPAAAPQAEAEDSPEATLAAYLKAMAAHNARADLKLYTADTRRMLARWVMTPAQMSQQVRSYLGCRPEPARRDPSGRYAVIRYAASERACAPWFLSYEGDRWRLDLTMMQKAIRFSSGNAWRFVPGAEHPYGFAFSDWRFDRNGFPRTNLPSQNGQSG